MRKRRKHGLLLIISVTGMMLSLCGCGSTNAKETQAILDQLAAGTTNAVQATEVAGELLEEQTNAGQQSYEAVTLLQVESHTPEGVAEDELNCTVNTILAADREFLGGYPMDESFLFWFRAQYGEAALKQVAAEASAGADVQIWYEQSGSSIHVLWLDYCRQYGLHSDQLDRVTIQECTSPDETVISFTGDMNFDDRIGTMQY